MHEASIRQHPLLADYGVALSWHDLGHLVLSEKAAERAALACAAYLRRHSKPSRQVFSLHDGRGSATWDLAQEFARGSSGLQTIWSNEKAAARDRKSRHWDEVTRKQRAAVVCRAELEVLKNTRDVALSELNKAQSERDAYRYHSKELNRQVQSYTDRYNAVIAKVTSKENELRGILAAPTPVFQPLPSEEASAYMWLFFLHMKTCAPHLQCLARISFLAQQVLLVPCEPTLKRELEVIDCIRDP